MKQPTLFDLAPGAPVRAADDPPDAGARAFAVDPANDVVLEASAGTGKTRVLVDRYVRLLEAGVDPRHILAITFTRKAAAEMRERVIAELERRSAEGLASAPRARALRRRLGDIEIATIDAFCFGLLREFPLEANVDPAFEIADETEMARFANEALDLTLRDARALVRDDEPVRLLLVRVKLPVLREAIASLLDRRHVAAPAVDAFVEHARGPVTQDQAARAFLGRVRDLLRHSPHRAALLEHGPIRHPEFGWLRADLDALVAGTIEPASARQVRHRLERYFLTKSRSPRKRLAQRFAASFFATRAARRDHEAALASVAPLVVDVLAALDADVNTLLARGLQRVLRIAVARYEALLEEHALLDFAGMLDRAVALLARQEEFARSRLKLQARYHHVLVDEFQDTSRLQWRLIELLVDAWGEGAGVADAPTSIFVVGDRKQSIYRFRHAEVTLLDAAARKIAALRPARPVRQAITTSFRAVPELLGFVNALSEAVVSPSAIDERFQYGGTDRFPVHGIAAGARRDGRPVLGLVAEASMEQCAAAVAAAIAHELESGVVRDRRTGARPARPDDIAILFRARAGHQYFEAALEQRGIRTYVYKGLGFFDAPEVQDLQALLRYLAQPDSHLRAAELLRSRLIRLSDEALARLAPDLAGALRDPAFDPAAIALTPIDRDLLARARASVPRWLALIDRVPPGEVVDAVLRDTAYGRELAGPRLEQARENLKKVRGLIRRVENRGYTTMGRLAEYFETLRAGEESNAVVAGAGAVNLMTIHAAKGLEFPIVFVVNLHVPGRGRSAGFSVIERGPDGRPAVSFDASDATALEDQRESEELRRLLYVAATRARDRLYFAAEVDANRRLRRGARSLAALLPASLHETFAATAAAPAGTDVEWASPAGTFAWRVWRAPADEGALAESPAPVAAPPAAAIAVTVSPLAPAGPSIVTATGAPAARAARPLDAGAVRGTGDDRLLGTLVHRLIERRVDAGAPAADLAALAHTLLRGDERVDLADPDAFARRAAAVFAAIRRHPEVVELLAAGVCTYEVPFSYDPPDRPGERVRGQVDCVVTMPGGDVTVLEFKTGRPRPEHLVQAERYAAALREALGGAAVAAKVVYAPEIG